MRIVVAPNAFKGSLTAIEASEAMRRGIKKVLPYSVVDEIPIADGGDGTVQALLKAIGGRFLKKRVTGPLGKQILAEFGILSDGKTAVIEMAAASGLAMLHPGELNPLVTTTYGTGELIKAALDEGCSSIILGIGGSATSEGGINMAQALGVRFKDVSGNEVGWGAQVLKDIRSIDMSGLDPRLRETEILVACDVDNPLCGLEGAAHVYGPQKGATPEMISDIDVGLAHLAEIINSDLGVDVRTFPGSGASGGLGAGLVAFFGAKLNSGSKIILEACNLEERIRHAQLVFTGEGELNLQTLHGKAPMAVIGVASKVGVPVIAVTGSIGEGAEALYKNGLDAMVCTLPKPITLQKAMQSAEVLLEEAMERVMRLIVLCRKI